MMSPFIPLNRSTAVKSQHVVPQLGFTLTELLVVIAIIAILGVILIPVTSVIREKANATKCASNMRHVGQAIVIYQTDNNGLLPPNNANSGSTAKDTWTMVLRPYIEVNDGKTHGTGTDLMNDHLTCPSLESTLQPDSWWESNYAVGMAFGIDGVPRNSFNVDTARTVMLVENDKPSVRSLRTTGGPWSYVGLNHNGYANVLFHDGHLEQWSESTIPKDYSDPAWAAQ
ncbi:type II secretion system protein [Cerasicoccus maritimus]|uniref:type II secretion system protein n=1 Tax=Cerasicoccus maritimus TaxID=490089 RepID=UPI002852DB07|nr:type II secretion system protein [Cerasicoccus maritimus]